MDVFSGKILIAFLLTFLTAFCRQLWHHLPGVQREHFLEKSTVWE